MHPRHDKGMRHNPNYRTAIDTLICVKAVSTPNTLLATVRSDRACQLWHLAKLGLRACQLWHLATLGLHVRT
jgi:hypothetical protein